MIRFAGVTEPAEIGLRGKYIGKRIGLFAQINELRVGKREDSQCVALHLSGEDHDLFGRSHGQGPQQNPVHDAKNCGVGADAEGQREDHDHRQHGRLPEHPEGVTDVLPERGHGVLLSVGNSHARVHPNRMLAIYMLKSNLRLLLGRFRFAH